MGDIEDVGARAPPRDDAALVLVDAGVAVSAEVMACGDPLSFWGGVSPEDGVVIDPHHPRCGDCMAGKVVLMPTSRGSCSGSGVLLELALEGRAPAALVFCEEEVVLTLGAVVADRIFGRPVTVIRAPRSCYAELEAAATASIRDGWLSVGDGRAPQPRWRLARQRRGARGGGLKLTREDAAVMRGDRGAAARRAMEVVVTMAEAQGATELCSVGRGHVDGCILAHGANLIFAEKMREMGARAIIPTTINAISVDRDRVPASDFFERARRLADAYVEMGCAPTFTCAPYLLEEVGLGEVIAWSESNAVIFANTVRGARTAKLPDYLDLCVAVTGRAPVTGMYTDEGRRPARIIEVHLEPGEVGDEVGGGVLFPVLGWLVGKLSPDRVPIVRGLGAHAMTEDDLKNLCAAFGTTSGAPMLHIQGHTPEAESLPPAPGADRPARVTRAAVLAAWHELNGNFWLRAGRGAARRRVDLVAIGSPHASLPEVRRIAELLGARARGADVHAIVCVGRAVRRQADAEGLAARLERAGVSLMQDICWCSIVPPYFPSGTAVILTNSGKYAHYGGALHGCEMMLGSLAACVDAMVTGTFAARGGAAAG